MSKSSIQPTDRTLLDAITPDQSEPGSDGNKGVLHVPQSSCITETSPSDGFVSYTGHSMEESNLSAGMQSVYSSAQLGHVLFDLAWLCFMAYQPWWVI